mgnify:FL=1|jgi:hypothetical protein
MSDKVTYEIRFWHGSGGKDYERWITPNEPEYLPSGAIRFKNSQGVEHYINGTIEVLKRA